MTAYHDEHENEYDLRAAQAKADPMTDTAALREAAAKAPISPESAADWLAECARYFDAQAAHSKEDSEHWAGVKNAEIARRIVNLIAPDGVAPCGYCATKTPGEGTAIVFKAVEPYLLPLANHDAVATAIASAMAGSVVVPDDRLRASPAPDRGSDERLEQIAADRADWLVDAVATSTQNRAFLRGEPEEDEVATESIYLNGKKAILVALSEASK